MKSGDKKTIYLLGASSMFNDAGSEMVTPILPYFISSLGGGGAAIGLISGLREGLSSLLKLFGGWFSDKIGKRWSIVFFGYLASVILKFFIGIAHTANQVTAFVSFERIGKIRDPPRDSIISHLKVNKGDGFGLHQMFDSLGGAIGTILIILIFWLLNWDFRTIVFVAGGVTALSLIPLFFVKDVKTKPINRTFLGSLNKLSKNLKKIIYITSIFAFANFGLYMFLILKTQEASGSKIIPLVLYAIFNLIYAFTSQGFGRISDNYGRKKVIISGYILFAIVCVGFAFSTSLMAIGILFCVYGLVYAMTDPVQKALISDLSNEEKGTAMGYYHFARGIATIIGGVTAGLIWDSSNSLMFIFLGLIALLALILFIKTKHNGK
jgi:MFS family permease